MIDDWFLFIVLLLVWTMENLAGFLSWQCGVYLKGVGGPHGGLLRYL
jgi:hypothetical protein